MHDQMYFATMCLSTTIAALTSFHAYAQCAGSWTPGWGAAGLTGPISAMTEWDPDGGGPLRPRIVAGISTTRATTTGAYLVCEWRDGAWHPIASEVNGAVVSLLAMPNGDLIASGGFNASGATNFSNRVARLSSGNWFQMPGPGAATVGQLGLLPDGRVVATCSSAATPVVVWDGNSWTGIGAPFSSGLPAATDRLQVLSTGDVVASGNSSIRRWTGNGWVAMGTGVNGPIMAMRALPNGRLLVAGGFTKAGGVSCTGLAIWLGGSQWAAFGDPLSAQGQSPAVWSLGVLPNGHVIAGGYFFDAGVVNADYVARWDGQQWNALPLHIDAICDKVLATHDGNAVLAGGFFTAGGFAADGVARWSPTGVPQLATPQVVSPSAAGGTLVLSASAATTSGPISVQWLRDGVPLVNGPGGAGPSTSVVFGGVQTGVDATSPIFLTITNVDIALAGRYSLRVSNACGTNLSDEIEVAVPQICDGDLNKDGLVDDADFSVFVIGYDQLVCP